MREFVHGHIVMVAQAALHDDEIVLCAGLVEGGGEFVGAVGPVFLFGAKGDDARGFGGGEAHAEGLGEETADLFKVLDQVAAGVFPGGGEELEVGGFDEQPGVLVVGGSADRKRAAG